MSTAPGTFLTFLPPILQQARYQVFDSELRFRAHQRDVTHVVGREQAGLVAQPVERVAHARQPIAAVGRQQVDLVGDDEDRPIVADELRDAREEAAGKVGDVDDDDDQRPRVANLRTA